MRPADINSSTYIDFDKENNKKDPKFEVDDYVRILKYKKILAKGYIPNCSEEVSVIKKLKILCRGHMLLVIIMLKNKLGRFTKNNPKKQIKKRLESKK